MNWQAIVAISEIIGTVAVVISLIYVGLQIKQSTIVARSTARQAVTELMLQSSTNYGRAWTSWKTRTVGFATNLRAVALPGD